MGITHPSAMALTGVLRNQPSVSIRAMSIHEKCLQRESKMRRQSLLKFFAGLGLTIAVLVCVPLGAITIARHSASQHFPRIHTLVWIEAVILGVSFVIAYFTRRQSRADVASHLLNSGNHSTGCDDHPFLAWIALLVAQCLLLGLILGEYIIIDAIESGMVRHRLKKVDRHRAAVMLAALMNTPAALLPDALLQEGETPAHLWPVIAYLIVNQWADLSPRGGQISLVPWARRLLRQ